MMSSIPMQMETSEQEQIDLVVFRFVLLVLFHIFSLEQYDIINYLKTFLFVFLNWSLMCEGGNLEWRDHIHENCFQANIYYRGKLPVCFPCFP